jgi:hypothetical protein
MELPDQTKGKGKLLEASDAMFEGKNVVSDFPQIRRTPVYGCAGLGGQQFTKRRLSSFDLARENRFPADERTEEEVWVGESPAFPGQSSNRAIGVGQGSNEVRAPTELGW